MRGVYTSHADISALAASKTLMYVTAAAGTVIEILSIHVTDYTNNTSEQWTVGLFRVSSLGTPTATTVTATKHEPGDGATAATLKSNVTASEPTYDATPIDKQGVSNLAGYHYDPIPEERPIIPGGSTFGLKMISTPTSTDVGVSIIYREIG